jgi:hypothetical protein
MSARSGDLPSARELPSACDGDAIALLLFRKTEWKGDSGEERKRERERGERERSGRKRKGGRRARQQKQKT